MSKIKHLIKVLKTDEYLYKSVAGLPTPHQAPSAGALLPAGGARARVCAWRAVSVAGPPAASRGTPAPASVPREDPLVSSYGLPPVSPGQRGLFPHAP